MPCVRKLAKSMMKDAPSRHCMDVHSVFPCVGKCTANNPAFPNAGFVRVLEILESPGILLSHFPGLDSPGKILLVLESPGNLLN